MDSEKPEYDTDIVDVTLNGLQYVKDQEADQTDFVLCLKMGEGDNPTVSILIFGDDHVETFVEFNECLPLEAIPSTAVIRAPLLIQVMEENSGDERIDVLLSLLAAAASKLEITAVRDGVCFVLSIGDFSTKTTVPLNHVETYLAPST